MKAKPTAIIVGPADKIEAASYFEGAGYYMPRAIAPPCESIDVPRCETVDVGMQKGVYNYTKDQCDAVLDAFAKKRSDAGVRVIRVHSMEERDAILTFVRQSVESLAASVSLSVAIYGHEQ
jgi:hypothetical protein